MIPETTADMLKVTRAMEVMNEHPDLQIEIKINNIAVADMLVLEQTHALEIKPNIEINMWYLIWRPSASSMSMLTLWSEKGDMKVERPGT